MFETFYLASTSDFPTPEVHRLSCGKEVASTSKIAASHNIVLIYVNSVHIYAYIYLYIVVDSSFTPPPETNIHLKHKGCKASSV